MKDSEIVERYWARDESAIAETDRAHGAYVRAIASNILASPQDAEECINDAYYRAWCSIPPARPRSLRAFVGRIARNLAIDRYRAHRAFKRKSEFSRIESEIVDCLPDLPDVESAIESAELARILDEWLASLPIDDRTLFVRRYWAGESLASLAAERGTSSNRLAQRMRRIRKHLKSELERKGVAL